MSTACTICACAGTSRTFPNDSHRVARDTAIPTAGAPEVLQTGLTLVFRKALFCGACCGCLDLRISSESKCVCFYELHHLRLCRAGISPTTLVLHGAQGSHAAGAVEVFRECSECGWKTNRNKYTPDEVLLGETRGGKKGGGGNNQ